MTWFLWVVLFPEGGNLVISERQYEMPDFSTCIEAVQNFQSDIEVASGGRREAVTGVAAWCASERVVK